MEQLIDFLPLLAFFITYKLADIYVATGVLIAASLVQVLVTRVVTGRFKKFQLYLFPVLLIMGTLTIAFHDAAFLKWKVTVAELILAAAFFISGAIGKPLIGLMFTKMMKVVTIPPAVIGRINTQWGLFSVFIAILNLLVAFGLPLYMDEEVALNYWVNFKVWGVLVLSLGLTLFTMIQVLPYMPEEMKKPQTDGDGEIADEEKQTESEKDNREHPASNDRANAVQSDDDNTSRMI